MKKFAITLLALLMFVPIIGCGGEKEYVEPEGVSDIDMELDDVPKMPGEE